MIEPITYSYFKNPVDGSVWAYDADQVKDGGGDGMTPLVGYELEAFLHPVVAPDYPAIERRWRDGEIESIKWLRERHRDQKDMGTSTTLTEAQFTELLTYLQLLRDWPQAKKFPNQKYRPVAPAWIADQAE
ncbi:hypothetical protein [Pseudomonas sp. O11]|uniref:hypothetical protein n=1 Tax=Pseudomonas sp. O11 TaxID=3159446 RepID=UPI00387B5FBB